MMNMKQVIELLEGTAKSQQGVCHDLKCENSDRCDTIGCIRCTIDSISVTLGIDPKHISIGQFMCDSYCENHGGGCFTHVASYIMSQHIMNTYSLNNNIRRFAPETGASAQWESVDARLCNVATATTSERLRELIQTVEDHHLDQLVASEDNMLVNTLLSVLHDVEHIRGGL